MLHVQPGAHRDAVVDVRGSTHSFTNKYADMTTDLSYPIGQFQRPASLTPAQFDTAVATLTTQPARLRAALHGLTDAQLDTPYRPNGWTVRQLAHHVADSHLNMYIRLKLALTEENPTIKPYDQDAWVLLPDITEIPIETSMVLFDAVQKRALSVLRNTSVDERARVFVHPDNGLTRVDQMTALYAWHGDHHIAHVTGLRARMGW